MTPIRATTGPEASDPRLRGRRYAVPFAQVWDAALRLASGRRGWTVVEALSGPGEIRAEARTPVRRRVDDVRIRLSLDAEGFTRVDVESASRAGRSDLGRNVRRIARFLHDLDRSLHRNRTDGT